MALDTSAFEQLHSAAGELGFLQGVVQELKLTAKGNGGLSLHLSLRDDTPILTKSSQKKELSAQVDRSEGHVLEERCAALRRAQAGTTESFQFESFCLRHASGGVLPFLERAGTTTKSVLLFERDIAPIGWNIANGASSNAGELSNIEDMILREAGEEILFFHEEERVISALTCAKRNDELDHAIDLWCQRLGATRGPTLDASLVPGPDDISVHCNGKTTVTHDIALCINADDFGIECVKGMTIALSDHHIPLDGEILGGDLLDRRVGLFSDHDKAKAGQPERLFQGGVLLSTNANRIQELCPVTDKLLRFENSFLF